MGWLYMPGLTRAELIKERTRSWANDRYEAICLRYAIRGNVLWTVWDRRDKRTLIHQRFIGCDLLRRNSRCDGWGFKDMDESMGPCYYTCPLSFLDLAPAVNEAWRATVRAYHARTRRPDLALQVGMTIKLRCSYPPEARIVSIKPFRGQFNGTTYRLKRRLIESIVADPAPMKTAV